MRSRALWAAVTIAALIVVGGVGVVYAWDATRPPPSACPSSTGPGGNTPLGTAMAFGRPTETHLGGQFWYNFSVQSAGGGVVMHNLNFGVETSTNGAITPLGFALDVLGLYGTPIANYSMMTGNWSSGGSTPLTTQQTIVLQTPLSLSGDNLFVIVHTPCQLGSVTVAIP